MSTSLKKRAKVVAKTQSQRFIEAAEKAGLGKDPGKDFEKVLGKIIPAKKKAVRG